MEILACPHCDRMFHATPAIYGKKIRCRGCSRNFHVPEDTSAVPVGPAVEADDTGDDPVPPVAIASVKDGRDVRSCPLCGRTFGMKPGFIGKTIRCRGCRNSFRVFATEAAPPEKATPRDARDPAYSSGSPSESSGLPQPTALPASAEQPPVPPQQAVRPAPPVPAAAPPPPRVFDDIGDVLEDLLPGETLISVVRPRRIPRRSQSVDLVPALVIAAALFGVCVMFTAHLVEGEGRRRPRKDDAAPKVAASVPNTAGLERPTLQRSPLDELGRQKPPRVTDKPKSSPLTPEAAAALEASLRDVLASLRSQDFAAAERALADAAKQAGRNREAVERVQRWQRFTTYAKGYGGYRDKAFKDANQGREYELRGEVIVVSEIDSDHIAYRVSGRNERVALTRLDPQIEMAIVGTWFAKGGFPVNHIYLGVRWLCIDPPDHEQALRAWQTARSLGAPVEQLLPILDEPFCSQR